MIHYWMKWNNYNLGACFMEQMNQGNKLDGKFAWKSTSWTAAINALMVNLNIKVDKHNIQARLKTWEKHYEILHPLLISCNSGTPITWDYTMGRIVVHDENVWNERLKANSKIAPYRKRITIENWDDICTIFSQDRADGQGSKTYQENINETEVEVDSATIGDSLYRSDEEVDAMRDLLARKKRKETTSSSCSLGSKKKTSSTKIISDYDKQTIKALDLMMHDSILFDTFVGIPVEMKYKWLKTQLDK
ncbi:hypothetical protein AAHA92_06634 [Salvia divinorum]|uniref:Myb/SANT-like domain-containing protein n=1 Tax=Salvia divinorum TaxID=28513 RepID=A0ABD1I736_SALDI